MWIDLELDESIVAQLDAAAGEGGRSAFIEEAIRRAIDDHRHRDSMRPEFGSIRTSDQADEQD